jgi:hypothetical protein
MPQVEVDSGAESVSLAPKHGYPKPAYVMFVPLIGFIVIDETGMHLV